MECEPAKAEVVVVISSTEGLVEARQRGRELALRMGFSPSEATMIAAAISELARNIVQYAGDGEILLHEDGAALLVVARDHGPGIADTRAAARPGYSTSGGLGLGLAGVQRISDEFEIISDPGGTTVKFRKETR